MLFVDKLICFVGCTFFSAAGIGPLMHPLPAQTRPPLVGGVGAAAIGPPAPTAVPIGGLPTRPLTGTRATTRNTPVPSAAGRVMPGGPVYRDRYGQYYVPVADAPLGRPGVVLTYARDNQWVANAAPDARRWIPSTAKPQWVIDTTQQSVDAWRDIIVTDAVCRFDGICAQRQQRLRARWIAGCGCYAFFDAWNRLWRVE